MSVTFWAEKAPRVLDVEYPCCDQTGCPHCKGEGSVRFYKPSKAVNMSNGNAMMTLRSIGVLPDYSGSWTATELRGLLTEAKRSEHPRLVGLFELAIELDSPISWG